MSVYVVRVKVTEADSKGGDPYHFALSLARDLASKYPGLTFEVAEDKVWSAVNRGRTPGGSNAKE